MKIKKLLAITLAAVMLIGLLASCGGNSGSSPTPTPTKAAADDNSSGGSNEPAADTTPNTANTSGNDIDKLDNPNVSIVYWYHPDTYASDKEKSPGMYDPILEAIPDFEAKYGGKVNIIYSEWNNMLQETTNLVNSGDAPDLFMVYDRNMHSVIFSQLAQPLDDTVSDYDYSFYDVSRDLFSWKGKTYAIPLKPYTFYFMFNKDLFDLEGLTYPDELFRQGKWNFDEFEKAGKALTKTVDGEVTQFGFGSWSDIFTYFLLANGGALVNVDTKTGEVTSGLNETNVQNTLNAYSRWFAQPGGFIILDDMFGWWDNGALGMIRGKEFPVDHPFEVGLVPFPVGPDYKGKNLVVYPQAMASPTGSKNKQGAVAFMRIVNEKQKQIGDAKEAERIGKENYDMIYASDVKLVYAYDKSLNSIDSINGTINNYMGEKVPAATIAERVNPLIEADIELLYKGK